MAPEKDYTHRSWIAVTLLIAVLIGLSLINPAANARRGQSAQG